MKGYPFCALCEVSILEAPLLLVRGSRRNFYACKRCLEREDSYSATNNSYQGKPDSLPTFSIEFETAERYWGDSILQLRGWLPTHDSSIGATEWKSPIYMALPPFRWDCFHYLAGMSGQLDDYCGTHVHVGIPWAAKEIIQQQIMDGILSRLIHHMQDDWSKVEIIWGRIPNSYCDIDRYSRDSRYHFINPWSKHDTLEYRLPKFDTAVQYYQLVRFLRKFTKFWVSLLHMDNPDMRPSATQIRQALLDRYVKFEQEFFTNFEQGRRF